MVAHAPCPDGRGMKRWLLLGGLAVVAGVVAWCDDANTSFASATLA